MLARLRRRRGVEALIELVVALACAAHARCTRGHNAIAHRPAGTRAGAGRRQQRQGGSGAAGGTVAVAVGGHSEALRASGSTASRASARGVPRPPPHPLRARDRAAHRRCLGAVGQTRRLWGGISRDGLRKPQHSQLARRATSPPTPGTPAPSPTQPHLQLSHSPTDTRHLPAPRVPTPPAACLRLQLQFIQAFPGGRWAHAAHGQSGRAKRTPTPYTFACASAGPCKRRRW